MDETQMTMLEHIQEWANEAGATHAQVASRGRFIAHASVLASCAANACGKYGRCWTCPPTVGALEELAARLQEYAAGVLVQNVAPLEDSWDFEGMETAMKAHNDMMRELRARVCAEHPEADILSLGCGGCGYCEKCSCPDAPCLFPEESISSVEGYGMDARDLVQSCGLSFINGVNTVSYVGLILVR